MSTLNYSKRLQNLQTRRFDEISQRTTLSENFNKAIIPENLKYLVESMKPIERNYNDKTFEAAERVRTHLENGLKLKVTMAYRTQGSVITKNNIKIHSDIDLLAVIDRYHYYEPGKTPHSPYTDTDPDEDIKDLRQQSIKIMKEIYDEVETSGSRCISIYNKSLKRKVDIVFCYWYHPEEYRQTMDEFHRGIYLYDFFKNQKQSDFPFMHMARVNQKGDQTQDGSRRATRLLKSLKADSETLIDLSSFQLTTIIQSIENHLIHYTPLSDINIARSTSHQLSRIIADPMLRQSISSPNGKEKPLIKEETVPHLVRLNNDLITLISDCSLELHSSLTQRNLTIY